LREQCSVYSIEWLDERRTVLGMHVRGTLDWETYNQATAELHAVMTTVCRTVHVIYLVNVPCGERVFPMTGALEHFTRTMETQAKNHGHQIFVGAPMLMKMTVQMVMLKNQYFAKNEVYFMDSLSQAVRMLQRRQARQACHLATVPARSARMQ